MDPERKRAWQAGFAARLKTKTHEQFQLLLCDLTVVCDLEQGKLVDKLLIEDDGHLSAAYWFQYLELVRHRFADRKSQLQRLVNKALEILPEEDNRNSADYLRLHICSAMLKSDADASLKYFQSSVCKRDIGVRLALMYTEWAEMAINTKADTETVINILQQGLKNRAEPMNLLQNAMSKYGADAALFEVVCEGVGTVSSDSGSEISHRSLSLSSAYSAVSEPIYIAASGDCSSNGSAEAVDFPLHSNHPSTEESSSNDGLTTPLESTTHSSSTEAAESVQSTFQSLRSQDKVLDPVPSTGSLRSNPTPTLLASTAGTVRVSISANTSTSANRAVPKLAGILAVGKCQRIIRGAAFVEASEEVSAEGLEEKSLKKAEDVPQSAIKPARETVKTIAESSLAETKKKICNEEDLECDADISMLTTTVKLDLNEPRRKKLDLSKYVDDKILKFDPFLRLGSKSVSAPTISALPSLSAVAQPSVVPISELKPANSEAIQAGSLTANASLMNSTLSSVESDAETAPHDLSLCDIIQLRNSVPASNPPLKPPSFEHAISQNEDKENAGSKSKRKRVSFAQTGEVKQIPQTTDKDRVGSQVELPVVSKPNRAVEEIDHSESLTVQGTFFNMKQVVLNSRVYARLGVLGKGGSSCVHRMVNESGQIYAYKRVDVRGNDESDAVFDSYVNEIDLLRRLKGSQYIIELIDAEINREEMFIAMVMEAGEIDLSKVLSQKQRQGGDAGQNSATTMNPFFIRLIWQEMLEAVDHIHENRIVHGDLKPANFVFVKGHLKLIDFGIAKAFSNDTTNIYRESQIGTVNYMAPESIAPFTDPSSRSEGSDNKGMMRLGRPSDIWSLGCILYQIIYGRPPFAALNTIQKLHAIPNPKYEISYPAHGDMDAVDSIQACLVRDHRQRASIQGENGLLNRPFLTLRRPHVNEQKQQEENLPENNKLKSKPLLYELEAITEVVQAVVDNLPNSALNPETTDALCIKVWGSLNQLSTSSRTSMITGGNTSIVNSIRQVRAPLSTISISLNEQL